MYYLPPPLRIHRRVPLRVNLRAPHKNPSHAAGRQRGRFPHPAPMSDAARGTRPCGNAWQPQTTHRPDKAVHRTSRAEASTAMLKEWASKTWPGLGLSELEAADMPEAGRRQHEAGGGGERRGDGSCGGLPGAGGRSKCQSLVGSSSSSPEGARAPGAQQRKLCNQLRDTGPRSQERVNTRSAIKS